MHSQPTAPFTHIRIEPVSFPLGKDFEKNADEANRQERIARAAPQLLEALEKMTRYLADLNGSEWIKGENTGAMDMRQRAKALQGIAFKATSAARGV